ncbi:unnamed protein product [Cuscuta campestris]|uniref:Agenet domain-containing protein n=1 Tax=Cuscuta campestris TaxID=132261 RepID=A0A484KD74_9ASTE|nr:unnamed protein product [Cuscuta campestris]
MGRVSKQQQKKKELSLSEGSLIEICTREKGLTAVWFEAVVLDPSPPPPSHARSSSKRACRVYVEYTTLLSDDGESPLRELVNLEYIRPRPPPETVEGFELYDPVDAFYKDGWWTGVVTQLLDSNRYVVTFRKPPDELEFGLSDLRLHHRWVYGKWVPPKRKNTTGFGFSVGKEVEVTFDGDDYKDAWYPSKLVEVCGNGYFMVDCMRPNTEIKEQIRAVVRSSHIRPCLPLLKNSKCFCLNDKVESFYDSGWWFGVIKEVLPDGRYVVVFQNKKKTERVLNHSELRPHIVWKDGKWHTSQGESLSPFCTLEDVENCYGLDIPQSAATHGSEDATTNETYGEKISRSLNSDGEMSEHPILWWPSNASVSPIKRKRRLELSKEGFSSESLSLIKCKKQANECKTPTEKSSCIISSPNHSSLGNTAVFLLAAVCVPALCFSYP